MIDVIAYNKTIQKDITFLKSAGTSKEIRLDTGRFPVKFKYFHSFMLSGTCPDSDIKYKVKLTDNHGTEFESLLVNSGEEAFINFSAENIDNYPEKIQFLVEVSAINLTDSVTVKPLSIDSPHFTLNAKFVDLDLSGDISRYSYKIRSSKDGVFSDFVDIIEDSVG